MDITINGKPADITLESEKNLGDFLTGLESWLEGAGHRISGIQLDGRDIGADALSASVERELQDVGTIAIRTLSWPELAAEALLCTLENISAWENASPEDKSLILESWREGAAGRFLAEQIPDFFKEIEKLLEGKGFTPEEIKPLFEERLRELGDPRAELERIGASTAAIAARLEDLPLDIQTGKDKRAAETIQLFSHIAEKLFRLLYCLKFDGLSPDTLTIESLPIQSFIEEFGTALRELTAAYEAKDAVLVGDLAEYELAPRLVSLYTTLKAPVKS
ncbi:MAG: hypothetical protein LBP42_02175 [Treponema sp.]|jgi:hypothetical protein|nr:hypothetical protein [Treponema sp.]